MARKIYSKTLTSVTDTDLFAQIRTATGISSINATKITLISAASFTYDINSLGVFSEPYLDPIDSRYKISTGKDEVVISSCKIHENGVAIWVAIEF